LEKANIAIIGGSGLERLFEIAERFEMENRYGATPPLSMGKLANKTVVFLPRHGLDHSIPPHMINYRANIYALHELGVERVISTNAVGAIKRDLRPGDLIVPHDFVDFTKGRRATFYDVAPVTHIDVSQPYCRELRNLLVETARKIRRQVRDKAVLVCTEGPRLETAAEIDVFRRLGCDIVGMTGYPEVVLAKELEMCYASVCYVSNMAAGMEERLSAQGIVEVSKQVMPVLEKILTETVRCLPVKRNGTCLCGSGLRMSRFE
jgi:5'-methylthioadenosine phosphorylase